MSFDSLGLVPTLLSAVQKAGFTDPTSVQAAAIPKALAGHDLMVSSQTGSGKTAAFMLPALNRISQMPPNKGSGVQVLVLTPTRELAMQVADATKLYGAHIKDLRIATVVGGMPYGAQLKALSRRVDVLVATPGRLIDHLQAKRVNLSTVHTLVLDEADRMLDMGFIEDIEHIVSRTPESRQTLLFSATLDGSIARLAAKMMRDPQQIEISGQKQKHNNITQSLLYADDSSHKMRLLDHLLRDANLDQAIVFTSTKRGADDLADRLNDQGFAAAALHGDMNQRQRTRTLGLLQNGRLRILVATDVAARGIDVQGISHAVNYDLPMQAEDYVHRIGRTGRAGRNGLAFTLATHSERHKVRRIEHFIGQPIPAEVIEGLEPKKTVRPTYTDRKGKGFAPRGGFGGGKPAHGRKPNGDRAPFGDRPGYEGKPRFSDKPAFEGKPRFADKPAFEGRSRFGDKPQHEASPWHGRGEARRGFGDKPAYEDRKPFGDDRGGYKGRSERPSFAHKAADKPAGHGKARPGFGGKPASAGKGYARRGDFA
ncbi:DEAD/DEAH box helicase [Parapusillimonas granuli]|uniref:DEAD/DEAH box helicase n=1 Tax=Parapusillimonas granuli TaxID=380911 RepID=A0A853G0Q9_9BURK|nr:DEAD/DEAH box helicase [Parapusillimonas granuli]MBB5215436.1 superfamily II DNA/RNA helicase [Parapusillimonas granuli]MEB2400273.1 DEAD/DEAH box helicase [Alcaligenaceae bacterium]NYT49897.1 DEAD/DEAH box helicase [Parapusillimonas granuli]